MIKVRSTDINSNEYSQAEILAQEILDSKVNVCGFDTETSVNFLKSKKAIQNLSESSVNKKINDKLVTLIQICIKTNSVGNILPVEIETNDNSVYTCYIFPIKRIFLKYGQVPDNLLKVISSRHIIKTGVNIKLDMKKLKQSYQIKGKSILDLEELSISTGNYNYSLNDLSKKYLGLSKLKSELGNFDGPLTWDQVKYAAYDSYLSLAVYNKMLHIKNTGVLFYFPPDRPELKYQLLNINVSVVESVKLLEFLNTMNIFTLSEKEHSLDVILNSVQNSFNTFTKDQYLKDKVLRALGNLIMLNKIKKLNNGNYQLGGIHIDEEEPLENLNGTCAEESSDDTTELMNNYIERYQGDVYTACTKIIKNNGIKRDSLLKSLDNSLRKHNLGKDQKVFIYDRIIDNLIKKKELNIDTSGKIYITK